MTQPGSSEDDLIAAALAAGKTHEEAAQLAGVSRSTVTRRLTRPEFCERVEACRVAILEQAVGLVANGLADAAAQLHLVCQNGDIEGNRVRAAIALFDLARRWFADFHVFNRIKRIEDHIGLPPPVPGAEGRTDS